MSETIADIVAEMREHNKETTPPYVCFTEEGGIDLSQIIDRIEAVTKCNQPERVTNCNGLNAAKMREAIELVAVMNEDGYWNKSASICVLVEKAKQALSAPLRNLDRFETSNDAIEAFEKETGKTNAVEFSRWLLAEAK